VNNLSYVTISAKIPKRLKELMNRYNIKPGPVIREALEREVRKRAFEELEKKAKEISKELAHISDEEITRLIREDRERD
jgi:oligoendopeptidase F